MRLYELLQAYDFDELMPIINDMFPGTAKYRPQLKEGFDILLSMKPVPSQKPIRYRIFSVPGSDEKYVGADDSCFRVTWDVALGKDVGREKGVSLSDDEMVANCLVNICLQGRYPKEFEKAHAVLVRGDR